MYYLSTAYFYKQYTYSRQEPNNLIFLLYKNLLTTYYICVHTHKQTIYVPTYKVING